jgi:hypothetical protein
VTQTIFSSTLVETYGYDLLYNLTSKTVLNGLPSPTTTWDA